MTSEQIENGAQAIYAANHYASGTSWNDLDERQQGFYRVQFLAALAFIREQGPNAVHREIGHCNCCEAGFLSRLHLGWRKKDTPLLAKEQK